MKTSGRLARLKYNRRGVKRETQDVATESGGLYLFLTADRMLSTMLIDKPSELNANRETDGNESRNQRG